MPHLRNTAPPVILRPPKHRRWFGIHTKAERAFGSYVRSTYRARRHPGRGLTQNANDEGGPARTHDAGHLAQRHAPHQSSSAGDSHEEWMVQFNCGVERHQVGCSSTAVASRECSTSTQGERAQREPMRLARGTSRPASIAARQATSRVTVTAEQGHQHLSSAGWAESANDCLLMFCDITCVERGGCVVAVWIVFALFTT